jgi:uncharacterized membrane protein YiaA
MSRKGAQIMFTTSIIANIGIWITIIYLIGLTVGTFMNNASDDYYLKLLVLGVYPLRAIYLKITGKDKIIDIYNTYYKMKSVTDSIRLIQIEGLQDIADLVRIDAEKTMLTLVSINTHDNVQLISDTICEYENIIKTIYDRSELLLTKIEISLDEVVTSFKTRNRTITQAFNEIVEIEGR